MVNENDDTTPQSSQSDDWLLPGTPHEQYADQPPQRRRHLSRLLKPIALVVAGLVAGGGVVAAAQAGGGDESHARSDGSVGSFGSDTPGGIDGHRFDDEGAPPTDGSPDSDQPGGPRGLAGEEHLSGTLTAVGKDTVTVKTASATATYQITDTTEVVRDGAAAQLSDLKAGDPVLVHVYPASSGSSRLTVERIFAGSLPTFPGGDPDGDGAAQDGAGQHGADQDGSATNPTTT